MASDRELANLYIEEIKRNPNNRYPSVAGLTIQQQPNSAAIQKLVSDYTSSLEFDRFLSGRTAAPATPAVPVPTPTPTPAPAVAPVVVPGTASPWGTSGAMTTPPTAANGNGDAAMNGNGIKVSDATRNAVEDPNKGKAGFAVKPSTGLWTRIPSNPQGMDWTFDEQMWAWKPPGDTRFKTVPVDTDSNGGAGGVKADSGAFGTNGANGTGGPIFTTDPPPEIVESPPAAPAVDPGSELPSTPGETHQDLANKYIRAIKADPLARTIVVDGVSSNSASLPLEVRKIINTYLGSHEYNSLATSAQAALPTRTTGNEGQPDAGKPAATGDPNEGEAGFFKSPFSGLWETPPQNPFGTWGEFNQSSWSWKNMQPAPAEPAPAPAAPTAPPPKAGHPNTSLRVSVADYLNPLAYQQMSREEKISAWVEASVAKGGFNMDNPRPENLESMESARTRYREQMMGWLPLFDGSFEKVLADLSQEIPGLQLPPTEPDLRVAANIEDMIANLKYTTSDGSVASVSLSEKQKGDLRSAYSTGGQEAFDALVDSILGHWGKPFVEDPPVMSTYDPHVATLYSGRIAKLTQDALDQDQGGFTPVGRLADEIQADQTINEQERGDLLALLSSKRSSLKPDPVPDPEPDPEPDPVPDPSVPPVPPVVDEDLILSSWNLTPNDSGFIPEADLNKDGAVNQLDLDLFLRDPEANQLEIIKGYTAQAEAGTLDPEGIAALGLSDAANSTVLAAYHAGVARRKQEDADANKAARAEAEATELAGLKARLLENPDLVINFNNLLTQSPNVARDLQAWMEDPNSEYTAAVRAAGMMGGGEVTTFESLLAGAGDVDLDTDDLAALRTAYNSGTNKEYAFNTELARIINAKAAAGEDGTEAFLGSPVEDLIANAGYNLPDGTRVPISLSETQKTELRAVYTARGQEGFDEYISEISDYWTNRDQADPDEVSPVDALIDATPFDFTEEQKNQLRGVYEVQGEEAFNTLRDEIAGVGDEPTPPAASESERWGIEPGTTPIAALLQAARAGGTLDEVRALYFELGGPVTGWDRMMEIPEEGLATDTSVEGARGRRDTAELRRLLGITTGEPDEEAGRWPKDDLRLIGDALPPVPSELGNTEGFMWLMEQGVSQSDAQKWFDWAKSGGREATVVEDPAAPTTVTEVGTEFDVTRDMDITSVLSRLPAIPAEMSNADAFYWLADSEINPDVDPKDAAAWANWAKENRVTKVPEAPEVPLEQYAAITPDLDPSAIKGLREEVGMADAQIVRAGEVFKGPGGIDAFTGYVEAFQAGTLDAWETNYAALMSARDEAGVVDEDEEVESLYEEDLQFEANVNAINIEDLILRLPTPPVGLDAMEQFFWLADQKDETGESILTPEEATAYYRWSLGQQSEVDRNTGVDGDGGVGDASDPSNLEKIQGTIAGEIEDVVQEIGFNSEEYKTSQTSALESYYGDARIRLGRQFAIDPGGPKTGRAQRNFEILEGERIQDLSSLASEVQDRLQAARDSTITNLTNAFSAITTGKIAEAQLDEQQRQFNTEIRETVRQFNNDLAIRLKEFGLNEDEVEAAIRKVNSDIVNNTRSISASISQAWADVTGELSVPGGVISLADLGIAEEDWAQFPFLPPSEDMVNSIRLSFEAMLGREMTGAEMNNLLANGRITVADKTPTQKAKEFAATIMQQNMERVSKWDAVARENELDEDKFADAKDRADKEWNRLNLEVAEQYGLDSNIFRNSMWNLDQRLSKIFFRTDLTEAERLEERNQAINSVIVAYGFEERGEHGAFLQAKDQYDLLYGDRESAVARAFGMDAETFSRANRQADEQEQRMLTVWSSLQESASTERTRIDDIYLGKPGMRDLSRDLINLTRPYLASLGEAYMEDVDDIGDGTSTTITEAIDWLFLPNQENSINAIRSDFESLFSDYVFTDDQLKMNMSSLLNNYQLEKAKNPDVAMADVSFHWEGTDSNWFSSLDPAVQTAVMSLISGSNFSPEREAGGASALQSIGVLLGTGLGAYAGFKTAGPAGIISGAEAGANVAATVTP